MAAAEITAPTLRRLDAEVGADRRALEKRLADVARFADEDEQNARGVGPGEVDSESATTAALAFSLDRAYTVLEAILERIARTLEGSAPVGEDWHRTLLQNAALDIEHVRPPVLALATVDDADSLRRFWHFLRHAYAADLKTARVKELAREWLRAAPRVRSDLDAFQDFLRRAAEDLER